jgi:hypothetical protein
MSEQLASESLPVSYLRSDIAAERACGAVADALRKLGDATFMDRCLSANPTAGI